MGVNWDATVDKDRELVWPSPPASASALELRGAKAGRANRRCRWNLLWFISVCLIFVPLPIWLPFISCRAAWILNSIVGLWTLFVLLFAVSCATYTMIRLYKRKTNAEWPRPPNFQKQAGELVHIVLMAGYKEPLEVMIKTLDTIKAQTQAARVFLVVALEERTPEWETKANRIQLRYSDSFLHILVTRHRYGVPGEIPGKCSNANFAARAAVERLKDIGFYMPGQTTFTTCDTDNLFPPEYLEALAADFLSRADRDAVIWQPPLFYNLELDKRPFFVRVTGILRGVLVSGLLIPQNINAMSIYSMGLALLEKGDFFHPGYQFVDAIDNLVRTIALGKTCRLIMLPQPVISGPTSGETFIIEVVEWARQIWRWTIGTSEIFHYFMIKWKKIGWLSGLRYGAVLSHYYGFVLCGMSLYAAISLIADAVFAASGLCSPAASAPVPELGYFGLMILAAIYILLGVCFVLDAAACRLLGVVETVGVARNVAHWASSPFVLLAYSVVAAYALAEVAVRGKTVCTHGASKKTGLV